MTTKAICWTVRVTTSFGTGSTETYIKPAFIQVLHLFFIESVVFEIATDATLNIWLKLSLAILEYAELLSNSDLHPGVREDILRVTLKDLTGYIKLENIYYFVMNTK
jgi:hypothetical protein